MITHFIREKHGCVNIKECNSCSFKKTYIKLGLHSCGDSNPSSFNEFLKKYKGRKVSEVTKLILKDPTNYSYYRVIICLNLENDEFVLKNKYVQEEMNL